MASSRKIKLSKAQLTAVSVLRQGGRIFRWNDETYGMDDFDMNTLPFRASTFHFLLKHDLIEVWERPSESCEIYTLASHFEI